MLVTVLQIHALSTGSVRLKHAFLYASAGARRQLDLFLPGPFSGPMPIHVWVIEHAGRRILVDTGESAAIHDPPFARFEVAAGEELPGALAGIGLGVDDLDTIVLTHSHSDHVDGAGHLRGREVLIGADELSYARSAMPRLQRAIFRTPLPAGANFVALTLGDGPFGAFAASAALTGDGRVRAVATPGHTPGHLSVLCVDDAQRHVLLAGDTTDSLAQLLERRADAVSPKPAVTVATIDRILEHARRHPLVYLPSHDPDSVNRLAEGAVVGA